jgi:hypothetical protein
MYLNGVTFHAHCVSFEITHCNTNFILLLKVHFNFCLVKFIDILCSNKLERPQKGDLKCYVGITVIQTCGLKEIGAIMAH